MKNLYQTLKVLIITGIAITAVSYVYAADWSGPTSSFPANNVDAPINASSSPQIKKGILQLGIADDKNIAGDQGFLGGLIVDRGATFLAGDLSVGTSTLAASSSVLALFNGKIGATQYCDTAGANCVTSSSLGGGSVTTLGAPGADSGWVTLNSKDSFDDTFVFHHNLGTTESLVSIESINGDASKGGFTWENKTADTIDVIKLNSVASKVRVRLWAVGSSPSLKKSLALNLHHSNAVPVDTNGAYRELNVTPGDSNNFYPAFWLQNQGSTSCTKSVLYSSTGTGSGTTPPTAITNWTNGSSISIASGQSVPSPTTITVPDVSGLYKLTLNCGSGLIDYVYIDHYSGTEKHVDGTAFPF